MNRKKSLTPAVACLLVGLMAGLAIELAPLGATPAAGAAVTTGGPVTRNGLDQLPLSRSFHQTVNLTDPALSSAFTWPGDAVAFTRLIFSSATQGSSSTRVQIDLNGSQALSFSPFGSVRIAQFTSEQRLIGRTVSFDPPLLIQPGDTLRFSGAGTITLSGYNLMPGEY